MIALSKINTSCSLNKNLLKITAGPHTACRTNESLKPAGDEIILSEEALSLAGKKICIDAGHGGSDSGAVGPAGYQEKEVNLKIALHLKELLESKGAVVTMTRDKDTDVAVPGSGVDELEARVKIANKSNADIFISVHNNASENAERGGFEVYHYTYGSDASKILSGKVYDKFKENLKELSPRGTFPANFYVIKYTNMPAILTESAFISNPKEEALLKSEEFQKRIASSIAQGVEDYFEYIKDHPTSKIKPAHEDDGTWDPLPCEKYRLIPLFFE